MSVLPSAERRSPFDEPSASGAGEPPDQPEKGADGSKDKKKKKKGPLAFLRELPVLLLVAFLLALLIKTFLIQAFYIPSASMEPTLEIGDRVLVNKVIYKLREPQRGEIIVFAEPHPIAEPDRGALSSFWHWLTEGLGVSSDPEKDFIKRVVALPGETIEVKQGNVFIDGKKLKEPYLHPVKDFRDYGPVTVPARSLFVMGDHRTNSNDSRYGLEFIPYDKVVGRAFVVIWPPSRAQGLRR